MSKRRESFSNRLSTDFLFFTTILFLAALFAAAWISHKLLADEATRSAQNLLDATVKRIENEIQQVEDAVDGIAWLVEEHIDEPEYMYHITRKLVSESKTVYGSAVAFPEGSVNGEKYFSPYSFEDRDNGGELKSFQLGNENYDYFSMEWYAKPASTGRSCWSEPYIDTGGGEMEMSTYSRPVIGDDGQVKAVITADFYLGTVSGILDKVHPYPHSTTILASATGKYIANRESGLFGADILTSCGAMDDERAIVAAEDMLNGGQGTARITNNGKRSLMAYGPLDNGWSAALICNYDEVLKNAARMNLILMVIGIFGLGLLGLLCYAIALRLTRPLKDFNNAAQSIAAGDFSSKLPDIDSEDEIRQLRDSFENMQNSLNLHIAELKNTVAAKERIESELGIASKIQMGIVPHKFPELGNADLHAVLKPAREIGGDFYDFFIRDGKTLYFSIGDVSGKGIPASLVMAITLSSFRFVSNLGLTLDKIVSKMNDTLCEGNDANMFVTLFVGRINLETGEMDWCNAGHNSIVIIDPDGKARFLQQKSNIAVGFAKGFPYELEHTTLEKGSRLVLYTDGVTEAEREDKNQYGNARLLEWAGNAYGYANAREACEGLLQSVQDFTGNAQQNDDITIMTLKIN